MFQAFIFDFDGVIVDSERHWIALDQSFFPTVAPGFTEAHAAAMMGLNLRAGYDYLVRELRLALAFEDYQERLKAKVHRVYHELAAPLPGLDVLLDLLQSMQVPVAIASSSEREWIDACLTRLELRERFGSISTPADVGGIAKPSPDVYLHAAKCCDVAPARCIAIEDSRNGIAAAKAAGMACIAIQTDMNLHQDLSQADVVVRALTEVTEALLLRLSH